MSLVACPECHSAVAENATSCPRCGCLLEQTRPPRSGKLAMGIGTTVCIVGLFLLVCGEMPDVDSRPVQAAGAVGAVVGLVTLVIGWLVG